MSMKSVQMNSKFFVLFIFACAFSETLGLIDLKSVLRQFVDLVQVHHLNVSIITSQNIYYPTGQLMQVADNALLLPSSYIADTQSESRQLNPEGRQWVDEMRAVTTDGSLVASYRSMTVKNGANSEEFVKSSNVDSIPTSPSYESIRTVINGIQGYVPNVQNWQTTYNFTVPDEGNQRNIQIIAGKVNIKLIEQYGSITTDEINIIEDIIPPILTKHYRYHYDIIAENIQEAIQTQLPGTHWIVSIAHNKLYADAAKSVTFEYLDAYITVFA